MRTIVDLPEEQIKILATIGKQSRLSRAEMVRRAVAEYIARYNPEQGDEAFGLWKDRAEDGLSYQSRLRAEWDE
ncbi:MAG: ribbon-helix-helix protein, CopG family [Gammaproteobacteria bacterium]|nr:ribbon-helix-helix protein, CopG family [Gammaproteobacteria bacterium]